MAVSGSFLCSRCGRSFAVDVLQASCDCGGYFVCEGAPSFDPGVFVAGRGAIWRYASALPLNDLRGAISLGEVTPPLVDATIGGVQVRLKLDHLFPTGSYKDRGSSVLISCIKDFGVDRVVEDSSGNAGASIAAHCAKAGIACEVLVPEATSPGKIAQIRAYGATVERVPGARAATAAACLERARTTYYASHNYNPLFLEGMKTLAFDIWEQMDRRLPDVFVTPAGYGSILLGAYLGFTELVRCGAVPAMPRLVAVQADACCPLYHSFVQGADDVASVTGGSTAGEGIACSSPIRGREMLRAVRETGGTVVTVTDEQIWESLFTLAREGIYVEPTAAVGPACLDELRERRFFGDGETVVIELSGTGLKATGAIQRRLEEQER